MGMSGKDRYGREIPAGCKDVKLNMADAWRTTYTHIQAGDVVRIETEGHRTKAAPPAAPKRSYWATVATVENKGRVVRLVMQYGEITEEPAHTAITRQERDTEYQARLGASAAQRAASVAEHAPKAEETTVPMVTGHEAESHSRRGDECRMCGAPVAEHESVDVKDSLAVAYWTGNVHGGTVDWARVQVVEARKAATKDVATVATEAILSGDTSDVGHAAASGYGAAVARMIVREGGYTVREASDMATEYQAMIDKGERFGSNVDYVAWEIMVAHGKAQKELLAEIEAFQTVTRHDGMFLPAGYSYVAHMALWEAGRIVPGSKTSGPGGTLGWYSVRMIEADHEEALLINDSLYVAPADATQRFYDMERAQQKSGPVVGTDTARVLDKCECESWTCFHRDVHPLNACDQPAVTTDWVDLCTECKATLDQPLTDEERAAFTVWEAGQRAQRKADWEAELLASAPVVTQEWERELLALPPVTDQVASIRRTLTGDALSMIDDVRDLDAYFGRPAPVDPWRTLRGKRKSTKVTRRAWQSNLSRRGR